MWLGAGYIRAGDGGDRVIHIAHGTVVPHCWPCPCRQPAGPHRRPQGKYCFSANAPRLCVDKTKILRYLAPSHNVQVRRKPCWHDLLLKFFPHLGEEFRYDSGCYHKWFEISRLDLRGSTFVGRKSSRQPIYVIKMAELLGHSI